MSFAVYAPAPARRNFAALNNRVILANLPEIIVVPNVENKIYLAHNATYHCSDKITYHTRMIQHGYKLLGHCGTSSLYLPTTKANAPKPAKILRKYLHEIKRDFEAIRLPIKSQYQCAYYWQTIEHGYFKYLNFEHWEKQFGKKHGTKVLLHFSRNWTEEGQFGDCGSCYYEGNHNDAYSHCPNGIAAHGGYVVRAYTTDTAIADIKRDPDNAPNRVGRAWVMDAETSPGDYCPTVCNAYNNSGHSYFCREIVARAIAEWMDGDNGVAHVDCESAYEWYVNSDTGYAVYPKSSDAPDYFSLPDLSDIKADWESELGVCTCERCDCRLHEEDILSDEYGSPYCRECFDENYVIDGRGEVLSRDDAFHCEETCEHWHIDEMVTVYDWSDGTDRMVHDSYVHDSSDIRMVEDWLSSRYAGDYVDFSR